MSVVGLLGGLSLCILPGAWLSFGLSLSGIERPARVLLALALSPIVVLAQFYALRAVGASFAVTAIAIAIINLPAAYLMYRRWREDTRVRQRRRGALTLLVWSLPLALLFIMWRDWQISAISAHAFLHSDIVYALANGSLRVEDAQLAGVTLGYAWGSHVPQAVQSWLLGRAPVATFWLMNAVLLVAAVGLVAEVAATLGADARGKLLTILLVVFAVNAIGYLLRQYVAPDELARRIPVWGDDRYTPWVRKYVFWSPHPLAHALFGGLLYVLVAPRSLVASFGELGLAAFMCVGLAAAYPLLMPPALALLAARVASDVYAAPRDVRHMLTSLVRYGAVMVTAVAATLGALAVIGEHRTAGIDVALSDAWGVRVKTVESAIVLSLLIVGAALMLVRQRRHLPPRTGILVLGALASAGLYVLFSIPPGANEYKYMFTAAMCLAPVAALGFNAWIGHGSVLRSAVAALLVLVLCGSAADSFLRSRYRGAVPLILRVDAFGVRLDAEHSQAASLAAIAEQTPRNTVVLVDSSEVHVPVFAQRSLYAPARVTATNWGVGVATKELLENVRGYGSGVVEQRQELVRHLFRPDDATERVLALGAVARLGRPIAVLLDRSRHAALARFLADSVPGELLHQDARWSVWFTAAPRAVTER